MTDFPTSHISGLTRQLVSAVAAVQSPFTLSRQIQDWGGEIWLYKIEATVHRANAPAFEAFANGVLNKRRPFILCDPTIAAPDRRETIRVSGSGQHGNDLVTTGWGSAGLVWGDFFSLGTGVDARLYQITADCTPSGGKNTLKFVPKLRRAPRHYEPVEIARPSVALRAMNDVPTDLRIGLMKFTIQAQEAI